MIVEFAQALREFSPQDFFPSDILQECLEVDSKYLNELRRTCQVQHIFDVVEFGETSLAIHPSGEGRGNRICFSPILPWYSEVYSEECLFQNLPHDGLEWEGGMSPIRNILRHEQQLYCMFDECVQVFDVDPQFDEPSYLRTINNPVSPPLIAVAPITATSLAGLSENGCLWIWNDDFRTIYNISDVMTIKSHPMSSQDHFILVYQSRISVLYLRDMSICVLFQTSDHIIQVTPLTGTLLIALSTDNAFYICDLESLGRPKFEWENRLAFGGCPIYLIRHVISDFGISILASTEERVFLISISADRKSCNMIPQKLPFCLASKIKGLAVKIDNPSKFTVFGLLENGEISYIHCNTDSRSIRSNMDLFDEKILLNDYSAARDVESSLKGRLIGALYYPDELRYLDYSIVWRWIWYGKGDAPPILVRSDNPLYHLGEWISKDIKDSLRRIPIEKSPIPAENLEFSHAANLLLLKWNM